MSYIGVRFDAPAEEADAWSDALLGAGALAIDVSDPAAGTPDEVRNTQDPLVHQFVSGLPDGPVRFHYPGVTVAQDFSGGLQ